MRCLFLTSRILLIFLWLLQFASLARAAEVQKVDDAELVIIAISINGQVSNQAVLALRQKGNLWWLPVDVLRKANVTLSFSQARTFNQAEYVPLASLPVAEWSFDDLTQSLQIQLPATAFDLTRLRSVPVPPSRATSGAGAFLNYDLLLDHTPGGVGRSVFTQIGASVGPGVIIADQWWIDRPELRKSLRLDTSYTVDDIEEMRTLRIGDSISSAPTLLGRPVRFGGLQWRKNFLTRPDMITVPTASLTGQSALPSTADLYVNNVLQSRSYLPPGPFSISTAPIVSGDGEVLLKLTDLSGQERLISQRFYSTTALLAAGLTDYSFEVGALRQNYGFQSNDYGHLLASASVRHGISDRLTVEGSASFQRSGPRGLLVGVSNALPGLGIATVATGISSSDARTGMQAAVGFERRSNRHSFSLRSQTASTDYRQIGIDADQTIRRLDSLFYGYQIAGIGSLGMSWTRQQRLDAAPVSIATASFSTAQTRWGALIISLAQVSADTRNTSLNLFWILSLGPSSSVSAFHSQTANGTSQDALQLQQGMPPGEGWGYRLQLARNAAQQAAVFAQNAYGVARLEAAELNGESSARAGFSGAVATLDGQWFLSRRIDSSFGVARLPGFANVRVYVDNQLAARTNNDGYALLPRLYPYLRNNVSVEQLDLPIDVQIDRLKVHPVPAWRSGVLINLPVRRIAAATLNLILEDGAPVPTGASVTLLDTDAAENTFGVGREGLVYLSGLRQDNALLAQWPEGRCQARISYQPEPGSIPYLGQYLCQKVKEAR